MVVIAKQKIEHFCDHPHTIPYTYHLELHLILILSLLCGSAQTLAFLILTEKKGKERAMVLLISRKRFARLVTLSELDCCWLVSKQKAKHGTGIRSGEETAQASKQAGVVGFTWRWRRRMWVRPITQRCQRGEEIDGWCFLMVIWF